MIREANRIFLVGIGGVAMSNLAIILHKMGKDVSGSDVPGFSMTDENLKKNNIPFITTFDAKQMPPNVDLVIYTGAHHGSTNEQVVAAQRQGIAIIPLSEATADLSRMFQTTIAVCGAHGKTTTSSLLAHTLKGLKQRPSFLVGTATFGSNFGGDYEGTDYFVIEADEYGVNPPIDKSPKFLKYDPQYVLCTNIDFDHPDIYVSLEEVCDAYAAFFEKKSILKHILCADDATLMNVAGSVSTNTVVTYGKNAASNAHIGNEQTTPDFSEFSITYDGTAIDAIRIGLFGEKNITNAAGVFVLLLNLGFEAAAIKQAFLGFGGAKRRFETVAQERDIYLLDDYAHHPAEIEATLSAARARFGTRRIIVIFHPHTYSRTFALRNEFVRALSKADLSLIAPIFASARENKEDFPVSSQDLEVIAQKNGYQNIHAYNSTDEIVTALGGILRKGDVVFTMGAGDIYKIGSDIISLIKKVET